MPARPQPPKSPVPAVVLLARSPDLRINHRRTGALCTHNPEHHQELEAAPGGFCGPAALITALDTTALDTTALDTTALDTTSSQIRIESWAAPYCQLRRSTTQPHWTPPTPEAPQSLGWNAAVSVTSPTGPRLVIARRARRLRWGGRWHATVTESTDGDDLASGRTGRDGELDVNRIWARALREELGITLPAEQLGERTTTHSLFAVGPTSLGVAAHLRLDRAGWTLADVTAAREGADDGWEIEELTSIPAQPDALAAFAAEDHWTPWGRLCFEGALTHWNGAAPRRR